MGNALKAGYTPSKEVPEGYKRTEVGVIPEEWEVDRIDQHTSIKTGLKNTQDKQEDGDYPFFVRSQEVERIGSYSYDGEAVLTAGDGVGTGKVFHYIQGRFDVHQRVYRITDFSDRLNGRYFFYQFSAEFYNRIMSLTAKSSVDSVRLEMIAGMQIPLPPPIEQRAIAEALSDVDGLLAALEELIAKKRAIKQAAMQQLLTGETRLPGFSGAWETRQLGDVAHIKTGSRNNQDKVDDGQYPFFVRSSTVERINSYAFEGEAILVPGEGDIGGIFHYINGRFDVHQRVYQISRFSTEVCGKFIYYSMILYFGVYAMLNTVKATVDSLRLPTFKNFALSLPSDVMEQRAIAAILSDMDLEIAALERCRDKTRAVKQGMMQQLLTGRIRLIQPETTTEELAAVRSAGRKHNWHFNEAVVISVLAKHFGNEQYPLGRMRYTKLLYLLHRRKEGQVEGYLKKAAGPYNPQTRYGGPEKIALQKDYMCRHRSDRGQGFIASANVEEAEHYFDRWYGGEVLQWLEQFRYKKNNDLELLTTVDVAVEELCEAGEEVSVESVKDVIRSNPEWEPKLDRSIFSDANLARAIESCQKLFDY